MAAPKPSRDGTPIDPLAPLLGYQLRRASNVLFGTLAKALSLHGLSVAEGSVLVVIAENDGVTQSNVGRLLDIHRANMVPIASKLARMGLTTCERRGRELLLRASPAGRRVSRQVLSTMHRHDAAHFNALQLHEREYLTALLHSFWCDDGHRTHAPRPEVVRATTGKGLADTNRSQRDLSSFDGPPASERSSSRHRTRRSPRTRT